ncbi:MAG: MerR family transcriptional regulator [Planctomycetes bacterium]|nr:MerR family transcriptional regulator [Planctomycetota bacterium]
MALFIAEAARAVGVSPATLKRWFRAARVTDVARDRNGYRVFEPEDIQRLRAYANQRIEPFQPRAMSHDLRAPSFAAPATARR